MDNQCHIEVLAYLHNQCHIEVLAYLHNQCHIEVLAYLHNQCHIDLAYLQMNQFALLEHQVDMIILIRCFITRIKLQRSFNCKINIEFKNLTLTIFLTYISFVSYVLSLHLILFHYEFNVKFHDISVTSCLKILLSIQ